MQIIFIDYDGVTHPIFPRRELPDEENKLFSYLPRLEGVLRDFPEIKIVISSSWRENRPWENVIKAFSLDIAARIIGATPVLKQKEPPYPKHPRYEEILDFLNKKNLATAEWVALDDDSKIYPPDCQNLILCDDGFRDVEESTLRVVLKNWQVQGFIQDEYAAHKNKNRREFDGLIKRGLAKATDASIFHGLAAEIKVKFNFEEGKDHD